MMGVVSAVARAAAIVRRRIVVAHLLAAVMSGRRAAVGHVKAAVKAANSIRVDNDELGDEVEVVKAGLGVIPGRVGYRPLRGVVDGDAEGCTNGKDELVSVRGLPRVLERVKVC